MKNAVETAFAQIEQARFDRIGGQIGLGRLFLSARFLGALLFGSGYVRLNRKEHMQASAVAQSEQAVRDFVHRILLYFLAALQAVSTSDAGEEQPQVIEDLGSGGDGRARIASGVLLLDGNGGRDPVDQIDVGLLNPLEKLARICGQRLDVTALAFGVERVEGERRFARTGDAGDDGQSVVLDLKINVLEVMNPGPANHNAVCRHLPLALQMDQNPLPNLSIIKRGL